MFNISTMTNTTRRRNDATSLNNRWQPLASVKPTFIWICAVSIILIQGQTTAFVPPFSLTQQMRCINQKPLSTTPIHKSQLSMVAKSGGKPISSEEQFEDEVLANSPPNKLTLVLFTAPWCGPCRLTNPVVKEIMKQYQTKLEVVEINTDDSPEVASNAGVTSIPTIQIYHGGKVKDTIVGCVSKNVLGKAVDKVLEDLGMLGDDEEEEAENSLEEGSS